MGEQRVPTASIFRFACFDADICFEATVCARVGPIHRAVFGNFFSAFFSLFRSEAVIVFAGPIECFTPSSACVSPSIWHSFYNSIHICIFRISYRMSNRRGTRRAVRRGGASAPPSPPQSSQVIEIDVSRPAQLSGQCCTGLGGPYPSVLKTPDYKIGGGCGCAGIALPQMRPMAGGSGCGADMCGTGLVFANGGGRAGYRATARNRKYLRRWRQGKSIGFTMRSSLKAKGLIPRANGTIRVSNKYATRRRRAWRRNL